MKTHTSQVNVLDSECAGCCYDGCKYVFVVALLSLFIQRFLLDLFFYYVFLAHSLLFKYYFHSLTFVFDEMVAFHGLFPLRFFAPSCQNHLLNPQSKSPKKKRHIWDTQVIIIIIIIITIIIIIIIIIIRIIIIKIITIIKIS